MIVNVQPSTMSEAEARELTSRIKTSVHNTAQLVLEAHDRRIWLSFGLDNFEEWAVRHVGLSRSQAFALLQVGKAEAVLSAAAGGLSVPVTIREAAVLARENGAVLAAAADKLRERLAEQDDQPDETRAETAAAVVHVAVKAARKAKGEKQKQKKQKPPGNLTELVQQCEPTDVAATVSVDSLKSVLDWLTDLHLEIERRISAADTTTAIPAPDNQPKPTYRTDLRNPLAKPVTEHIGVGMAKRTPAETARTNSLGAENGWERHSTELRTENDGSETERITYQHGGMFAIGARAQVIAVMRQEVKGATWELVGGHEHNGDPLTADEVRAILSALPGEAIPQTSHDAAPEVLQGQGQGQGPGLSWLPAKKAS